MHTAANDIAEQPDQVSPPDWPVHPDIEPHEPRNLLLMAAHQIVFRVGWIFKTESVIMPAFLDWLMPGSPTGMLRGCLPVLNRFGQSVPPVLCADQLKAMRFKKRALSAYIVAMSVPFAVLSLACLAGDVQQLTWMPWLFLLLYGLFFAFNGLYHMSFGTVQGKLIRPTRRGRLLLISTFWGTLPAMGLGWWLLDDWLDRPDGGFQFIFATTAVCFFLSGLMVLLLFEPADGPSPGRSNGPLRSFHDAWTALRSDRNLRCLVLVAMLFGSGLIIFPHYQALALGPLQLERKQLMLFVVAQNASVGLLSLFVGTLADALGNRLTLRTLVFGAAVAPLLAIGLSRSGGLGMSLFWLVFIPLGVTPLVLRILVNYALEISEPVDHPRYLSTVSLCLAAPFLFSPVVGWLVDLIGFEVVFLSAAALILLGGGITFRLDEPRHRVREAEIGGVGTGGEE